MFAVCVIALCLIAASHQTPLECEDSVRPLDHLHRSDLEGMWVLIAGSVKDPAELEDFKRRDSIKSHFVNGSEASAMSMTGVFGFGPICRHVYNNITIQGSGFDLDSHNLTVTSLRTSCPDCAVMRFDDHSKELKRFYLFSRKNAVDPKEMEEFKAQVECLHMPPMVVMDPAKDLCQDPIAARPAA